MGEIKLKVQETGDKIVKTMHVENNHGGQVGRSGEGQLQAGFQLGGSATREWKILQVLGAAGAILLLYGVNAEALSVGAAVIAFVAIWVEIRQDQKRAAERPQDFTRTPKRPKEKGANPIKAGEAQQENGSQGSQEGFFGAKGCNNVPGFRTTDRPRDTCQSHGEDGLDPQWGEHKTPTIKMLRLPEGEDSEESEADPDRALDVGESSDELEQLQPGPDLTWVLQHLWKTLIYQSYHQSLFEDFMGNHNKVLLHLKRAQRRRLRKRVKRVKKEGTDTDGQEWKK